MMAKLAYELSLSEFLPSLPVVVRFCGTSKGSANGFELVTSICRQILLIFDRLDELSAIPAAYDDLVTYFHKLLAEHAVILMIDSIDQLTNENLARSNLSFLRGVKPHRDTRIIVSALPDEKDADGKWIYCYGCDTKLAIRNVPRVVVRRLEESKAGEILIRTTLGLYILFRLLGFLEGLVMERDTV